jgi:hypothetical protein
MADQSHLDILRQGVEVWNSWKGGSAIDVVPDLSEAELDGVDLSEANLSGAYLFRAKLSGANLSRADLTDATLTRSALVETNLTGTTLTGCSIYGISAWSLKLEGATQHNLNVSPYGEPTVMVDNLEVAQFVYPPPSAASIMSLPRPPNRSSRPRSPTMYSRRIAR